MIRQKVTPFLWFNDAAEEAARFYVSLFAGSAVTKVTPGPSGKALVVAFVLAGVPFLALNGGPHYTLNEAFSLSVDCESQAEIDDLWEKLTANGGEPGRCGWLKDAYGLSWQLVPAMLPDLLGNPETAGKVMPAMMGMTKLDIAALQAAAN
jgi:predicted 3-demethylubiquinone-9 3-methyltransferase (glyoxalase superfamily)